MPIRQAHQAFGASRMMPLLPLDGHQEFSFTCMKLLGAPAARLRCLLLLQGELLGSGRVVGLEPPSGQQRLELLRRQQVLQAVLQVHPRRVCSQACMLSAPVGIPPSIQRLLGYFITVSPVIDQL